MSLQPHIKEIPYRRDSGEYFAALTTLRYPVWLDSCHAEERQGRYDIMSASPTHYLETVGTTTSISVYPALATDETCPSTDKTTVEHHESASDPFELIKQYLPACETAVLPDGSRLPLCGGALGYWGYDLGRRLEHLPAAKPRPKGALPDMAVGIYSWSLIVDHWRKKTFLVAQNQQDLTPLLTLLTDTGKLKSTLEEAVEPFKINGFQANTQANSYFEKFDRIQHYIREGDCYQVNFAQRFYASCAGDPLQAYRYLRDINPAPFAGFIPLEGGAILSLSPERFIAAHAGTITTSPIKGTIARGASAAADQKAATQLRESSKDQAENLMIVDLLRNDLSRTCRKVRVPRLFELQSFTNVHHLVSTIEAELKDNTQALDVLRAAFPGGSITGAPKIRAMEIIDELESHNRGPYCGSLGYISSCGNMDTNIAIRTLVVEGDEINCWGGGGIVADSQAQSEYEESITKVAILLRALEAKFGDSSAG